MTKKVNSMKKQFWGLLLSAAVLSGCGYYGRTGVDYQNCNLSYKTSFENGGYSMVMNDANANPPINKSRILTPEEAKAAAQYDAIMQHVLNLNSQDKTGVLAEEYLRKAGKQLEQAQQKLDAVRDEMKNSVSSQCGNKEDAASTGGTSFSGVAAPGVSAGAVFGGLILGAMAINSGGDT